jgi:hypothetical protein
MAGKAEFLFPGDQHARDDAQPVFPAVRVMAVKAFSGGAGFPGGGRDRTRPCEAGVRVVIGRFIDFKTGIDA